ncbi:hypothetical protein HAX54_050248 [Datura stramonium]|uniref:Uncharacterized protein n=1 Tax=Datura stramonium TaxID=4076 RepID=A0ABS8WPZ2_DATST|nr:hypothetical protein [Datura stramonium]
MVVIFLHLPTARPIIVFPLSKVLLKFVPFDQHPDGTMPLSMSAGRFLIKINTDARPTENCGHTWRPNHSKNDNLKNVIIKTDSSDVDDVERGENVDRPPTP